MTRKHDDHDFQPNLLVFERIAEGSSDVLSPLQIVSRVWAQRYWAAAIATVFVILGFAFLAVAQPKYTVEILVGPAASDSSKSSLAGGGAAAALAGMFDIGGASSDTPFMRFETLLVSERIAAVIEAKHHVSRMLWKGYWNESRQSWEYNPTGMTWFKDQIKDLLGLPVWQEPNPAMIAEKIGELVEIKEVLKSPYLKLKVQHPNPDFAADLLVMLCEETNASLRAETARQTRSRVEFLRARLAQETIQEYRLSLTTLLADQEKSLMLVSSDQPYAAVVLDGPTTGSRPSFPKPMLVLVLALAAGVAIGSLVAFVVESRRLARQESAP